MMRAKVLRLALGLGGGLALGACFNTDFLAGTRCESDDECGGAGYCVTPINAPAGAKGYCRAPGPDPVAVAGGDRHTCVLTVGGDVICWGDAERSRLGGVTRSGDTGASALAVTDAVKISAGAAHSCALQREGAVVCWGENAHGELGDGSYEEPACADGGTTGGSESCPAVDHGSPRRVATGTLQTADVACGDGFSCLRGSGGDVFCWGRNDLLQLASATVDDGMGGTGGDTEGDTDTGTSSGTSGTDTDTTDTGTSTGTSGGTDTDTDTDTGTSSGTSGATDTDTGTSTGTTGTDTSGDTDGGTVHPSQPMSSTPLRVELPGHAQAIAVGRAHACAVVPGGVYCWGSNEGGQLGLPLTTTNAEPVEVPGLVGAIKLAAGARHTCALLGELGADGVVAAGAMIACWGANDDGQLGDGSTFSSASPVLVGAVVDPIAIVAGDDHTCALTRDGSVACWGANAEGQLGDGSTSGRPQPTAVVDLADVVAIGAGSRHTCAVRDHLETLCWGANDAAQLAIEGSSSARPTPATPP